MYEDEHTFASPSGLPADELGETLVRAFAEVGGGRQAAVELLRRTGGWLQALDAAGFVSVGRPHPDDPEGRPRARIRWGGALEALERGGPLHVEDHVPGRDVFLLRFAAALAGRWTPGLDLDLGLGGVGRETARYVLAAVSHATASHTVEHQRRLPDGRDGGRSGQLSVGTLVPWPEPETVVPWVQDELPMYPARLAEQEAQAWADANPAPEVVLPLRPEVVAVLEHLRWASGMRGAGLGRVLAQERILEQTLVPRADEEVEAWLGFPLPDLAPVREVGHDRRCYTREPGPLPARAASTDGLSPGVLVYWIPRDVPMVEVAEANPDDRGVVVVDVFPVSAEELSPSETPSTRFDSTPGGVTSVTVGGTRLTLQRFAVRRTRVVWGRTDDAGTLAHAAEIPLVPVEALELLLRSPRLL